MPLASRGAANEAAREIPLRWAGSEHRGRSPRCVSCACRQWSSPDKDLLVADIFENLRRTAPDILKISRRSTATTRGAGEGRIIATGGSPPESTRDRTISAWDTSRYPSSRLGPELKTPADRSSPKRERGKYLIDSFDRAPPPEHGTRDGRRHAKPGGPEAHPR